MSTYMTGRARTDEIDNNHLLSRLQASLIDVRRYHPVFPPPEFPAPPRWGFEYMALCGEICPL
jgi:hypothetical protein